MPTCAGALTLICGMCTSDGRRAGTPSWCACACTCGDGGTICSGDGRRAGTPNCGGCGGGGIGI
jgi:hypothetical protein